MNFFVYTILESGKENQLIDFMKVAQGLTLPVRIGIIDCRKNKFDSFRKQLKKMSGELCYVFASNSIDEAHNVAMFHAKSSNYIAAAFCDVMVELDEFELAVLLVRAQDQGAVVPKINSLENGLGFEVAEQNLVDFSVQHKNELVAESNVIPFPRKVFALSGNALNKMILKNDSDLNQHELYRDFVHNNIRFKLIDNVIFNEKRGN